MGVVYDQPLTTGWPSLALSTLRRKIGAHARHHAFHQKVGITNWPERRWAQYYAGQNWDHMRVLYMSSSWDHVCTLEAELIDTFRDGLSRTAGYYHNAVAGGGGRIPEYGPYYLYVVNAPRGRRFNFN
jgi:hypothetical protein